MSIVRGSDLAALRGESHCLNFTHHMMLIPQGPPVKLLVTDSTLSFPHSFWSIQAQTQYDATVTNMFIAALYVI